jgi:hypothetical protein
MTDEPQKRRARRLPLQLACACALLRHLPCHHAISCHRTSNVRQLFAMPRHQVQTTKITLSSAFCASQPA